MLKDSHNGLCSELLSFWTFSIVQCKTKAKRLKLQRFESRFCFRLQVKNGGGGRLRGDKPNQSSLVFEISSLNGTWLIRVYHTHTHPFSTWRRKQNSLLKHRNFSLLVLVLRRTMGKVQKLNNSMFLSLSGCRYWKFVDKPNL